MELLKGLSPAAIDSEFRNMAPDAGGSVEWLEYFMEFLLDQLKTNKNYELVQSYLGLFLKVGFILQVQKNAQVSRDSRAKKYTKKNSKDNNGQNAPYILFSSNRVSMKSCVGLHFVYYYPYYSCLCTF